jgi:hypothetical protein
LKEYNLQLAHLQPSTKKREEKDPMSRTRTVLLILALLFLTGLAACNLPGMTAPPTPFPSSQESYAQYTAAAETIVAQLTQVSNPASPTPLPPSMTPTAADTSTPIPPLETATDTPPPAPTEPATPEISPTPAPPTATLQPGDPRAGLGEPTWRDTFEDGSNWYLYVDRDAAFEIKDTGLVMTAYTISTRNAWMLTQNQPLNFYLEVTAQPQECAGLDRYGVIVRSDSEAGYLFGFTCDGRYSFRRWNGTRMTKLVEWTAGPNILKGANQTNRLGIRVNGGTFSLYANGTLLTEVPDDTYSEGGFGVYVGADQTKNFTVLVDEVDYWELP